ncbi:MAG: hypothetical protein LC722_08690 [Actinobacteria bacterium]|nr:hypothetical protein [Actinomycetota bacterium]
MEGRDIEVPDEERVEELRDDEEPGATEAAAEAEVPTADAQEQAQPLRRGKDDAPSTRWDVPEADSMEQARAAYVDEDEDDFR